MFASELPLFSKDGPGILYSGDERTFASDATSKILGVEYQKLIAIEKCLESKLNDVIYLECFGDVARNKDETREVKHHSKKTNLTNTSPDFWKTLRNHVRDRKLVQQFTKLIFHTTGPPPVIVPLPELAFL